MAIELELVHHSPQHASLNGVVQWDEETGELTGPQAERLRSMAAEASARGYVTTHPYPTAYEIGREPLRSRRDLALIISTLWIVPEPLRDALPAAPSAGEDSDVPVLF